MKNVCHYQSKSVTDLQPNCFYFFSVSFLGYCFQDCDFSSLIGIRKKYISKVPEFPQEEKATVCPARAQLTRLFSTEQHLSPPRALPSLLSNLQDTCCIRPGLQNEQRVPFHTSDLLQISPSKGPAPGINPSRQTFVPMLIQWPQRSTSTAILQALQANIGDHFIPGLMQWSQELCPLGIYLCICLRLLICKGL